MFFASLLSGEMGLKKRREKKMVFHKSPFKFHSVSGTLSLIVSLIVMRLNTEADFIYVDLLLGIVTRTLLVLVVLQLQ